MALKVSTIDVILGMDWLKAHDAHIHYGTKTVQLTHPSGKTILYTALTFQHAESQIYALNALNASPLECIDNFQSFAIFSASSQKNCREYPRSEMSNSSST